MSDSYQMTGAIALPDGVVAEVGHQGADVVILRGKSRMVLDATRRNEFIHRFFEAERHAEHAAPAS